MRAKLIIACVVMAELCWTGMAFAAGSHNHADHNPAYCHELRIGIANDALGGAPIMRPGKFPIKVQFFDRGYGVKCGNGLRIFIDFALAHKNDNVSDEEYTWDLDLSALSEGLHYIVVNACDHNDHIGVSSLVIDVRKCRLPGMAQGCKIAIPLPPKGGPVQGILPPMRGEVAPPAFDTDLQPSAIACCGDYGDWPVAADCKTMIEVPSPEDVPGGGPGEGDF